MASHPLSQIWSSPRLLYRLPSTLPTSLVDAFFLVRAADAYAQCMSSTSLPAPPSRNAAFSIRDFYATGEAIIGVVICLKPENYDSVTSTSKEELTIIGTIDLTDSHGRHHRAADLGMGILEPYRGKGYGSEAIQWILNWGFMHAGLHRVHLTVSEFNDPARKCYKKVGFKEEGVEREALWLDGRWWSDVHMGILETEWREERKVDAGSLFTGDGVAARSKDERAE